MTESPTFDLVRINEDLAALEPREVVGWAVRAFGEKLVMSSSFGAESAVLLHMASEAVPKIRVIFVDTGFLFQETQRFIEELRQRLRLNIALYRPLVSAREYLQSAGESDPQQRRDIESCCRVNKNEPFERAMRELRPLGWLRGIRSDQTATRRQANIIEWASRFQCWAISPLLRCSTKQVQEYLKRHDLPFHPLYESGYVSIGCSPLSCTRPLTPGEDVRGGRWSGTTKTECGLHVT